MRWLVLSLCFIATSAPAATPTEILALNTRAMVYLEVNDAAGQFIDSGTGFIVSHNGYVVTAAHLKPAEGQKLWGVIGQRQGTRFIIEPREVDEANDVALWQLPQSAACHYAVTLTTAVVESTNRVVALGFPGATAYRRLS
jgi:S1-C subfamily serine protease